jgi:aquaporin Z
VRPTLQRDAALSAERVPRRAHWAQYLIEAWGLGTLMFAAGAIAVGLAHASPMLPALSAHPVLKRMVSGTLIGLTVMAIVYSPWGARSGAHCNPALTITFGWLGKVAPHDMLAYVIAQFAGGALGFSLIAALAGSALTGPPVNGIVTLPGPRGPLVAFAAEAVLAFVLMSVVLIVSNARPPYPRFTGVAAALCIATFVTLAGPLSGVSLNPARTTASALVAHRWEFVWIYYTAPLAGMLLAAAIFVRLRGAAAVRCARLNHTGPYVCLFRCGYSPVVPTCERSRPRKA